MIRAALIGHPVNHSKSPRIHKHWLRTYGIDGDYTVIDTPPEKLQITINDLIANGYAGFNVTLPHKVAVMSMCETLDQTARAIGAVNTVTIRNGKCHGMNTDAFGFIENLRAHFPGLNVMGKTAVVLGAGGAARAVIHTLSDAGIEKILLINRTAEHAQILAEAFPAVEVAPWPSRSESLSRADLLVNTTSLGMIGKDPLDLALDALPPTAIVCDIVYAPLETDLLHQARARGNPVCTGIGMLLHQARAGFKTWFGRDPVVTPELEAEVMS